MNESNKHFINVEVFNKRVLSAMKARNTSLDALYHKLNKDIGYTITKNNLSIYLNRIPNTNFLIALCKALNVSSDYLLGLTETNIFDSDFDLNYESKRYKKYEHHNYNFYFIETASNTSKKVNKAKLSIKHNISYQVSLSIETEEKYNKVYTGEFLLSKTYNIGYITLKGTEIGEVVHLSFYDPIINGDKLNTELFTGAMISVSAGDIKKSPVLSKFIVSRKELEQAKLDAITANLLLNTKYIEIDSENFKSALETCSLSDKQKEQITNRIKNAFNEYKYFKLEESYILNTLAKDFKLSKDEATVLVHSLRLYSNAKSNYKINRKTDSRLFELFYKE